MPVWRDQSRFNAEGFYGELQWRLRQQQEVLGELQQRSEDGLSPSPGRRSIPSRGTCGGGLDGAEQDSGWFGPA
eukprot:g2965.t1